MGIELRDYENKRVRLHFKINGYLNAICGVISKVGKDSVLFIEWHEGKEIPINKKKIEKVEVLRGRKRKEKQDI